METDVYHIIEPASGRVPFLLSLPHCGTGFPSELRDEFVEEMIVAPDDTDWNLDLLYDFAPTLGITTVRPEYSRWVIDLNRHPSSKPLYDDGRIATALCPATDFQGVPIYKDRRSEVDAADVEQRIEDYFDPYHKKIDQILERFVSEFGIAVFWDGHSIRRRVPTIQTEPFPDFILGDNDGSSCNPDLINTVLKALGNSEYDVTHNMPFKGGYLTRSKGNPSQAIHAMQLEMSKDLYMVNDETVYSEQKAQPVKKHLSRVLEAIVDRLSDKNYAV